MARPSSGDRPVMEGDTGAFEVTEDVQKVVRLCQERKAGDVVVLDLRGISSATDFFLICSGTSDVHVKSIAEHIRDEMKQEDVRADHVEGLDRARWVLLDYIDFVVHILHPSARDFYQLENLWGDAARMEFGD